MNPIPDHLQKNLTILFVGFNPGKGVYQQYSRTKEIPWGAQKESVAADTIDFVAPSSSGLVRMKLAEIIEIYRQLVILKNK